ncbi:MAG: hypothetical protein K2L70_06940 [Clostridia bacterium]|nr:hypothetical protein [Clostridia bacterium]
MRNKRIDREFKEMCEYSTEQLRNASAKERLIHKITLAIFLSEFALIGVGIILAVLRQNFICLGVTIGILILTVIIGAKMAAIKRTFISISIKCSKYNVKDVAEIIEDTFAEGTTVNGELTKATMKFIVKVNDTQLIGYKKLKVKKIRKKKDFQTNEALEKRLGDFLNDIEENGRELNIMYIPNKKYCVILDSADYIFNYFIMDILFAEK